MALVRNIFEAAVQGLLQQVEAYVLEPNFDPNARNSNGWTALHYAAMAGQANIVKLLLQKGADVNARAEDGFTALMAAAAADRVDTVKIIIELGKADINQRDDEGATALIQATRTFSNEVVRLLLRYGAYRHYRTSNESSYQHTAQGFIYDMSRGDWADWAKGAKEELEFSDRMKEFTTIPDATGTVSKVRPLSLPPSSTDIEKELLRQLTTVQWRGFNYANELREVDVFKLASPPQTLQHPEKLTVMQAIAETKVVGENRKKRWTWIHVPANNMLWVRWAIQHLPTSYQTAQAINLISVVEEALDEVQRTSGVRQVHFAKKEDVVSAVMPYLTAESGALLESQSHRNVRRNESDSRFHVMWTLVDEYGSESRTKEQKGALQSSQSLDQSYSILSNKAQDSDQVIYRWTNAQAKAEWTLDEEKVKANTKLLMVNQVWLWKVDDLVVTAFPEPWTHDTPNHLLSRLNRLWLDSARGGLDYGKPTALDPEAFVSQVLRQCIILSDIPVYGSNTWASIFEQSITDRRGKETTRYKAFSDYISEASSNGSLKRPKDDNERMREFTALYDISVETEELRQTRDIRDEIRMIRRVIDNQRAVLQDWKGEQSPSGYDHDIEEPRIRLSMLDHEAAMLDHETERVEKRFNELLDLKQKQGSLNFAAEADKRDRENEKQSQLLFIFTVITVIFTPLNFIAALFAIPTREYPHSGDNVSWKLRQSSAAMVVTEVICVFSIVIWFWKTVKESFKNPSHKSKPPPTPAVPPKPHDDRPLKDKKYSENSIV